jgi:CheY-like chemotaxis protein
MKNRNSPYRLLVVDDDPFSIELFWRDLPSDRFEVVTAADGAEAFDLLTTGRFDILVADVLMPVVDGLSLISLVRSTQGLEDLPIVVVTSHLADTTRNECLKAGANEFMTKPLRTSDIPEILERVVAQGRRLVAPL